MERLRKTLILLLVAGIPAAAPPLLHPVPSLCFTAGPLTYQFSPPGGRPDIRVQVGERAAQPDLRIQLVDRVELADFVLIDDDQAALGNVCHAAGLVKSVALVADGSAPDVRVALSPEPDDGAYKLFLRSARVSPAQAAALFAAMRQHDSPQVAAAR
jgi:hypothetical protein